MMNDRTNQKISSLLGRYLNSSTYVLKDFAHEAKEAENIELLQQLARELSSEVFIMSDTRSLNAKKNDLLEKAGYSVYKKKLFVEHTLKSLPDNPENLLSLRSLEQLGKAKFINLLTKAAEGDPFEDGHNSPDEEYAELVAHAGSAFNTNNWYIVFHQNSALGVLLPQVYEDKPSEGSLFYIGVMPKYRGLGYGSKLHALGLWILKSRGVTRYVGSTGLNNKAMVAIFMKNGCRKVMERLFWKPS